MKIRKEKRQFVTKSGDTFEWEESEETRKALEQLHKTKENDQCTKN